MFMQLIIFEHASGLFQQLSVIAHGWVQYFNQVISMFLLDYYPENRIWNNHEKTAFLKKKQNPQKPPQNKNHKKPQPTKKTPPYPNPTTKKVLSVGDMFRKYCDWYSLFIHKASAAYFHLHRSICSSPHLFKCHTSFGMHVCRLWDWSGVSATTIVLFLVSWNAIVDCTITSLNP